MRRLCSTFAFVVLSLTLLPGRADAYIWAWLDDLSGPRYLGGIVEWRVYCRTESIVDRQKALADYRTEVQRILDEYAPAARVQTAGQRYHVNAAAYARFALVFIDFAIDEVSKNPNSNVDKLVMQSRVFTLAAIAHGQWGDRLRAGERPDPKDAPGDQVSPDQRLDALTSLVVPGVGVTISLCDTKPGRRDTQFLSVNVGYAWDVKDENREFKHRMVTVGASYHLIASPSVTLGAGAGLAIFTSKVTEPVHKLYLQPAIVDIRPWQFFDRYRGGSPWYHVVYVRGSLTTFPTGFAAGSFGNQPERYQAELIRAVGVHFDFTPVLLDMQGKWPRRQK
jgi:hypothetical protein